MVPFGQGRIVLEDDVRDVLQIHAEADFPFDEPRGALQPLLRLHDLLLTPNEAIEHLGIAEIVADNVCREIARRIDAIRPQEERPDAEGFYAEHYERLNRLLPRLHQMQLPEVPTEPGAATAGVEATEAGGDGPEAEQTRGPRSGRGKKKSAAETPALF